MTTNSTSTSWREAILDVLKQENGPLHYQEILQRIEEGGMRAVTGKTPAQTVSSTLSSSLLTDGLVEKVATGVYQIRTSSTPVPEEERRDQIDQAKEEDEFTNIAAYGLYWERDKVLWNPGQGRTRSGLLGISEDGADPVDFSNQAGIYVLHKHQMPMYVGRTRAETNALFARLLAHHSGDRRGSRWNQFSWFGFRRVVDGQVAGDSDATISIGLLITVLESVMIEAFIPPLNDKGGELLGTLYAQMEDPELTNRRNAVFLETVAAAISPDRRS